MDLNRMSAVVWSFGDATPYVSAAFGLVGTLIGGAVAGTVTLRVARHARAAAERAWVRDSRRAIYDRFLTAGQRLLAVMETAAFASIPVSGEFRLAVDEAYSAFFETYASVQTVAELRVVRGAREQAYRLQALKDILDGRGTFERKRFGRIAELVRDARQDTIDAMRADLGLEGSAKPPVGYTYREAVAAALRDDPPPSVTP
jgi:hypothetical protein